MQNRSVGLIDADPNQHSTYWAEKEGRPDNIELIKNVTEKNIV